MKEYTFRDEVCMNPKVIINYKRGNLHYKILSAEHKGKFYLAHEAGLKGTFTGAFYSGALPSHGKYRTGYTRENDGVAVEAKSILDSFLDLDDNVYKRCVKDADLNPLKELYCCAVIDINKLRKGKVYSLECFWCKKNGLIFKYYAIHAQWKVRCARFKCRHCSTANHIPMKNLASTPFKVGIYPPGRLQKEISVTAGANSQNGHSTAAKGERAIENYTGNKYVQGLYHKIINNIPQHHFYYELFAGSAAIATIKTPAPGRTVINDCAAPIAGKLREYVSKNKDFENWQVTNNNALDMLQEIILKPEQEQKKIFVYLDPPYLGLKLYKEGHDLKTHQRLVQLAGRAKCMIMISHYKNELYENLVKKLNWRKDSFNTAYHGKPVTECIYMNYPQPDKLHDYKYLGKDCWDRQRIKRKIDRWIKKLQALPVQERNALVKTIKEKF